MKHYIRNDFIKVCAFPYYTTDMLTYPNAKLKRAFKVNRYFMLTFRIVKIV